MKWFIVQGSKPATARSPHASVDGCHGDVLRHQYRLLQQPQQRHNRHQACINTHVRFPSPTELSTTHVRQAALPLADTEVEVDSEYIDMM